MNKVRDAIERYGMLSPGDGVIVALSGGADSVALLKMMSLLKGEYGIDVCACHVNHRLRGDSSDSDERFVRDLCAREEIELTVRAVDVKSLKKKHESIEEAARKARYNVFEEISKGKKVATAHTATDNAETVLINLIRGTGLKGLCGIPPVRENIIRPLILCERDDTERFCRENNLDYVNDSTNFSLEFTRNKIRHNLIPMIRELNPSFVSSVSKMCGTLRDEDEFLEFEAFCELRDADKKDGYDAVILASCEKPLLNRIISIVLSQNNISPSFLRISQIFDIIKAGKGKVNLEKNRFATVCDGKLKIMTIFQNYKKK